MDSPPTSRMLIPAMVISAVLFAGAFMAFKSSQSQPGTIVLPGGITYLGPTPTTKPPAPLVIDGKIPVPADATWTERNGALFPYSFSYPETLSLGVFPDDPFDAVTVFYPGTDSNANIFFRVDTLTKLNKKQFIGKPSEYANTWWKEYAWKGVTSVTAFTNSRGLSGYRAKYKNEQGVTPYDHVFFEVPGSPDLIIWLSGRIFTPETFDRLVDSVSWKKTK